MDLLGEMGTQDQLTAGKSKQSCSNLTLTEHGAAAACRDCPPTHILSQQRHSLSICFFTQPVRKLEYYKKRSRNFPVAYGS